MGLSPIWWKKRNRNGRWSVKCQTPARHSDIPMSFEWLSIDLNCLEMDSNETSNIWIWHENSIEIWLLGIIHKSLLLNEWIKEWHFNGISFAFTQSKGQALSKQPVCICFNTNLLRFNNWWEEMPTKYPFNVCASSKRHSILKWRLDHYANSQFGLKKKISIRIIHVLNDNAVSWHPKEEK